MQALNAQTAQNQLSEIARMAYGSGVFEKTSGGKGNIGLYTGADGQTRVIKFNTHSYERGGVATDEQIRSSNDLRTRLIGIAQELNPAVMDELRAKLGLGPGENPANGRSLLTRKIAAEAVKLISRDGMSAAMRGVKASTLRSVGGTKFEESRVYAAYGVSAKTLKACGMSTAEFEASVSALAEKFNLPDVKKQTVGRVTASYLNALAEEGKAGPKDELRGQIADGTFGGAFFGLLHVRAISPLSPPSKPHDNMFLPLVRQYAKVLTADECVDAAYFIAKTGTGKRGSEAENMLTVWALRALLDHRTDLMALHMGKGKLSVNDMLKAIGGPNTRADAEKTSALNLNDVACRKFYDEVSVKLPQKFKAKWPGGYDDNQNLNRFIDSEIHIIAATVEFGVSPEVAIKLFLHEEVDDIQCSHGSSGYDEFSSEFVTADEQRLIKLIAGDIKRITGGCSIRVGSDDNAYTLAIPRNAGENFANTHTPGLMSALNRLAGGGDMIGNPVSKQLKTMCFMSQQAGNTFLTLAGVVTQELDHWPVNKSFERLPDGAVLYTGSAEVDGVTHTVKYRIETDGSSRLVDYTRFEPPVLKSARKVAKARLAKLTDFVNTRGTEAEKANLANYKDGIVTSQNVRTLEGKVLGALSGRPASVVQNVTTNLMAVFAEINLRQAAKGLPLDSFETLLSRYAGSDEQIRLLDFSLTPEQIRTTPGKMKNWFVSGFLAARQKDGSFNPETNVHLLSLREYSNNVTINGIRPLVPSKKDIVDGDRTITFNDVRNAGRGSGKNDNRYALHEMLIKTFPDRDLRAFVSMIISFAEGVRGYYTAMFNAPGEDNVAGQDPKSLQFGNLLQGMGMEAVMTGLTDIESLGDYAITVEPDQVGQNGAVKKGKVTLVVKCTEGMSLTGRFMTGLRFDRENAAPLDLARQKYETTVTIDPNEIDENGLPSFTVGEPVLT